MKMGMSFVRAQSNKKITAAEPNGNIHGQPSKSDEEERTGGAGYLIREQGISLESVEQLVSDCSVMFTGRSNWI